MKTKLTKKQNIKNNKSKTNSSSNNKKSSKSSGEKFIRLCPRCGSINLKSELYITSSPESINFSGLTCEDCGYEENVSVFCTKKSPDFLCS